MVRSNLVKILRALGLTKAEYIALNADDAQGFASVLITSTRDKRTWAEKEAERDNEGWTIVR